MGDQSAWGSRLAPHSNHMTRQPMPQGQPGHYYRDSTNGEIGLPITTFPSPHPIGGDTTMQMRDMTLSGKLATAADTIAAADRKLEDAMDHMQKATKIVRAAQLHAQNELGEPELLRPEFPVHLLVDKEIVRGNNDEVVQGLQRTIDSFDEQVFIDAKGQRWIARVAVYWEREEQDTARKTA